MIRITRRRLMMTGGIGAAAVVTGGAWLVTGAQEEFIAGLVQHYLQSEPIAPGATEAFAADYMKTGVEDRTKVEAMMQIQRLVGYAGLEAMLGDNRSFDHFKRRVATTFMLSSTFFYRETRGEPVKFTGLNIVCNNPFARFD